MELEDVLIGIIIGGIIAIPLFYLLTRPPPSRIATMASVPKTTYRNIEEWEIVKNMSGRTTGVRVKRTASES